MLSFRLGAFGWTVLEVELSGPEPVVVHSPGFVTESSGCFFAETASDVEYETIFSGGCGDDDCCSEDDE